MSDHAQIWWPFDILAFDKEGHLYNEIPLLAFYGPPKCTSAAANVY